MPIDFSADIRRLGALLRRPEPSAEEIEARLERIEGAVLIADDEGRCVAANQRAAELTGYSKEELLRLGIADLTPVRHAAESRSLWLAFLDTREQKGRYEVRRKDGTVITVGYAAWSHIAPGLHVSVLTF